MLIFAMPRHRCTQCSAELPQPDEDLATGHIACPQCGKQYAIRKEKKNKLTCPSCGKK